MTEKLYYSDAYTRKFSARVLSCAEGKKGFEAVLDRTAFYPEGGGQPGDSGYIGGVRVTDTHERGGEIVHYCAAPLEAGSEYECEIDWDRRFDFMQQHSGEHIVSGIVHRRFGLDNVGFHMGAQVVTIDFNGFLSPEQLGEVEREANGFIWRNVPFNISFPDGETLKTLPYRSKKELTGQVRIVECEADICACCGTHVSNAGEVGLVKLLSSQRFHDGVRIEMASGRRAYDFFCTVFEQNRQNSVLLSSKPEETAAAAQRMFTELEETKYSLVGCQNKYFSLFAEGVEAGEKAVIFEPGLSSDGVRRLADALVQKGGLCAVFSGSDGEGYKYAVGKAGGDLRELVKEMNASLNGRGGGKPFFAQGSVQAAEADIRRFFEGR